MNGKNENTISLLDMMEDILKELNRTEDLKGKNPGEIMRLYNTTLYSSEVPEHLRSHREDIDDIFTENFASSLESKIKEYTGDNKIDIGLIDKIKQVESDFQNSYLLESYLSDTVKSKYNYTDEDMRNLFGYRLDSNSSLLSAIMEDSNYGQSVADSLNVLKDTSAWMESKFNPTAIQINRKGGVGVGRGLHQFEKGKNQAGETAIQRMKNAYQYYGLEIPENFKQYINQENPDFSTFPIELQNELFYADKQQDPKFILSELGSGETSMKDAYINHHYRGDETDRISNQYDAEMKHFKGKEEIDNLLDMYYNPTNVRVKEALRTLKPTKQAGRLFPSVGAYSLIKFLGKQKDLTIPEEIRESNQELVDDLKELKPFSSLIADTENITNLIDLMEEMNNG